jgi:hypothetical protein
LGISNAFYCLIESGARGKPLNPAIAKRIAAALHFDRYGITWVRFYDDEPESEDMASKTAVG